MNHATRRAIKAAAARAPIFPADPYRLYRRVHQAHQRLMNRFEGGFAANRRRAAARERLAVFAACMRTHAVPDECNDCAPDGAHCPRCGTLGGP
jgi:hypothetical protein